MDGQTQAQPGHNGREQKLSGRIEMIMDHSELSSALKQASSFPRFLAEILEGA